MRKASKIIFLVAGIYSIATVVLLFVFGILFEVMSSKESTATVIEAIERGIITTAYVGTVEEKAAFVQSLYGGFGVAFFIFAAFGVVNSILAFIARGKDSKGIYVLNIIFGILSLIVVNVVGAIFGMIALNQKPQERVVE